jgi:Tfp pilus assembly protein PilF
MALATELDREWVGQNMNWLDRSCREPWASGRAIVLAPSLFPRSFASSRPNADVLLDDLCGILTLQRDRIGVEFFTDARDIKNVPLELHGLPTSSDLVVEMDNGCRRYKVEIANAIKNSPNLLLKHCILETSRIVAHECEMDFSGEDIEQLKELFAVYLGFGPVLSNGRFEVSRKQDGMWEEKSRYVSALPLPVFAYAVALQAHIRGTSEAVITEQLSKEVTAEVRLAYRWITDNIGSERDIRSLEWEHSANDLARRAEGQLDRHDYESALETFQALLFVSDNDFDKIAVHNNIGYVLCAMGQYEKSLRSFEKALSLDPDFAYAKDNMGFALIMSGQYELGRSYVEQAMRTAGNHPGYSYRNMALYHWKSDRPDLAQDSFERAFQVDGEVDFLDLYYARFLMERGQFEEAEMHAERAMEKGEPGAAELLEEVKAQLQR